MNPLRRRPNSPSLRGFSFVELIVAVALAALVLAATVVAYGTIMRHRDGRGINLDTALPTGTLTKLYGVTLPDLVTIDRAPSLGTASQAESLRWRFFEDLSTATAVFALDRTAPAEGAARPKTLSLGDTDPRSLDSPNAFRSFLAAAPHSLGAYYPDNQYQTTSTGTGSSVFILNTSDAANTLNVRAIYEVDFVVAQNPAGLYASVRRFSGTACTDYYHIFYPAGTAITVSPPASPAPSPAPPPAPVAGEMQPLLAWFPRKGITGGGIHAVAEDRPFYFVWWPDPMAQTLESVYPEETLGPGSPRAAYSDQAGRTSFFFVVPAFPGL